MASPTFLLQKHQLPYRAVDAKAGSLNLQGQVDLPRWGGTLVEVIRRQPSSNRLVILLPSTVPVFHRS